MRARGDRLQPLGRADRREVVVLAHQRVERAREVVREQAGEALGGHPGVLQRQRLLAAEPHALQPHDRRAHRDAERLGDLARRRVLAGGEDPRARLEALALDVLGEARDAREVVHDLRAPRARTCRGRRRARPGRGRRARRAPGARSCGSPTARARGRARPGAAPPAPGGPTRCGRSAAPRSAPRPAWPRARRRPSGRRRPACSMLSHARSAPIGLDRFDDMEAGAGRQPKRGRHRLGLPATPFPG